MLEAPDADAYDRSAEPFGYAQDRRSWRSLLVNKYRVWGIEEIAKPEVFRVRPLSEYGTFMAVAELFEGTKNLKKTVDELQVRLYAAA